MSKDISENDKAWKCVEKRKTYILTRGIYEQDASINKRAVIASNARKVIAPKQKRKFICL